MKKLNRCVKSSGVLLLVLSITLGIVLSGCRMPHPPQTYTIGVVNPTPIMEPVLAGFKARMTELGYVEGENTTYLYDGPAPKDELERVAQSHLDEGVDLILALTTPGAQAAQKATSEHAVPVVFVPVTDPVGAGLVSSLREPGGNLTGITTGGSAPKRLEALLQVVPEAERIYLPYNPGDKSATSVLEQLAPLEDPLGVELVLYEAADTEAVEAAIANIPDDVDAIFIGPDSLVGSLYADWVKAAIERELPLSGSSVSHVEAGMLLSYSYDTVAAGRQAARLADQIFKGAAPRDLPVETSEFFLSLNLKTARAIGLDIPDEILSQAKEVFP